MAGDTQASVILQLVAGAALKPESDAPVGLIAHLGGIPNCLEVPGPQPSVASER